MDYREFDIQFLPRNKNLNFAASKLRSEATAQEKRLWSAFLKNVKPKFTRQKIIGGYIADFYCHEMKLAIELDGSQHSTPDAIEYDKIRTEYFETLGITVLRFTNAEIDNNLAAVCKEIKKSLNKYNPKS